MNNVFFLFNFKEWLFFFFFLIKKGDRKYDEMICGLIVMC